jgi:hypothetical protein
MTTMRWAEALGLGGDSALLPRCSYLSEALGTKSSRVAILPEPGFREAMVAPGCPGLRSGGTKALPAPRAAGWDEHRSLEV